MKFFSYIQKVQYELLALVGAFAILWPMLGRGYILTLDLVWVPNLALGWNTDSFNNTYPLLAFLKLLSFFLSSWMGEDVMLFLLFFALFCIPMRFMPLIASRSARVFVGALYALNPFVYARMLAGHWLVLFGYALLPLFLYTLQKFAEQQNKKTALYLGVTLAVLGMFSVHFLYLALLLTGVWLVISYVRQIQTERIKKIDSKAKPDQITFRKLQSILIAAATFLVLSSYWLVPALGRHSPVEARFDAAHFAAFAASANAPAGVPVLLNVAALGGYWGEGTAWSLYFVWPQANPLFWVAAALLACLVALGVWRGVRKPETRFVALVLLGLGVLSYITALGASDTIFKSFNIFLYSRVPLWGGLRDSQKIVGLLAFVYAVFAGLGVEYLLSKVRRRVLRTALVCVLLTLPATFGMYEWRGFAHQLQPVDYPQSWYQAKAILDAAPAGEKALVLPWHGYLSLAFDHQLVVSNPAPAFFGAGRVVSSRSIDVGAVHDEEISPLYRQLDQLFMKDIPSPSVITSVLQANHIQYVLILKDSKLPTEANWSDALSTKASTTNEFIGIQKVTLVKGAIELLELDFRGSSVLQ